MPTLGGQETVNETAYRLVAYFVHEAEGSAVANGRRIERADALRDLAVLVRHLIEEQFPQR